jgi:hypothetical protein
MNKNGRGEFLEQDASIEQFANNQPTSSVARVIVLTRMASALSRSCLTFAYSSPDTALVSTTLPLIILSNPIEFYPTLPPGGTAALTIPQKALTQIDASYPSISP